MWTNRSLCGWIKWACEPCLYLCNNVAILNKSSGSKLLQKRLLTGFLRLVLYDVSESGYSQYGYLPQRVSHLPAVETFWSIWWTLDKRRGTGAKTAPFRQWMNWGSGSTGEAQRTNTPHSSSVCTCNHSNWTRARTKIAAPRPFRVDVCVHKGVT